MHKKIALKGKSEFTLKQLRHVSVQSPSSGSALFVLNKVTVVKVSHITTELTAPMYLNP